MMRSCRRILRCSARTAMQGPAVIGKRSSGSGSPDFVSHVNERVNRAAVGTDVRGHELEWWTQVRSAFPDMVFSVDLLIESGEPVVINGVGLTN
jgi:hypothetical protein